MKLRCIACEALARLVYAAAARSSHTVDISLIAISLHSEPPRLRERIQSAIDNSASEGYDAVVLAYGLCGKSTAGLKASGVQLVMPRAHDCITLFLGGRERYQHEFSVCPGTYWYTADYIERGGSTNALGVSADEELQKMRAEFAQTYGEENADYLMEAMGAWGSHYTRAAFIELGYGGDCTALKAGAEQAEKRGWKFDRVRGDPRIIEKLLDGDWDDTFLIVPPGATIEERYDDDIVGIVNPADRAPGER